MEKLYGSDISIPKLSDINYVSWKVNRLKCGENIPNVYSDGSLISSYVEQLFHVAEARYIPKTNASVRFDRSRKYFHSVQERGTFLADTSIAVSTAQVKSLEECLIDSDGPSHCCRN
ncbi:hypothetical protein CDAR_95831 [Caerostris darwini]|uniref:Uncharacterized protein n=1 Tax=Caerostris darwini TaxID=1538125 RepID=A0AAV4UPY0_9ARAC|nr:hypothetical protein CDAR_95831 [Caerostris darwini]